MKTKILIALVAISLISGKIMANPFDDSLSKSKTDDSDLKSTYMLLVSAADLGFKGPSEVKWNTILDSAVSHGYKICPQQTGFELYMLLQYVNLRKMPFGEPVFIGMKEVEKSTNKGNGYVYCMKPAAKGKEYKLVYAKTSTTEKGFAISASDKFVFAGEK